MFGTFQQLVNGFPNISAVLSYLNKIFSQYFLNISCGKTAEKIRDTLNEQTMVPDYSQKGH